jgi:hypothetical protein
MHVDPDMKALLKATKKLSQAPAKGIERFRNSGEKPLKIGAAEVNAPSRDGAAGV